MLAGLPIVSTGAAVLDQDALSGYLSQQTGVLSSALTGASQTGDWNDIKYTPAIVGCHSRVSPISVAD